MRGPGIATWDQGRGQLHPDNDLGKSDKTSQAPSWVTPRDRPRRRKTKTWDSHPPQVSLALTAKSPDESSRFGRRRDADVPWFPRLRCPAHF